MQEFDAVIAGGGIAGSSTAAALARNGMRVLVCESGLPNERRLAGELFHPPAAATLERLGLLSENLRKHAVPSYGFVLFRGPHDHGTLLSYSEVPNGSPFGLATEHAFLTRELLTAASKQPGIEVWEGARVTGAEYRRHGTYVSVVRDGQAERVACRLLVSAEGRASKLREQAGIASERCATHRMIGWRIQNGRLPFPGYGHIFLGGPATALAYAIAPHEVRVMFEIDAEGPTTVPAETLACLPADFRAQVESAIANERASVAKVVTLAPQHAVAERFAVVGDAGGCSHPLTASGIAASVKDAVLLADAVAATSILAAPQRLTQALARYDRTRRKAVRTRVLLAAALRDALYPAEPDMKLLRDALFDYWHRSPRGRQASIGLLTTQHDATSTLLREYAGVSLRAFGALRRGAVDTGEVVPALTGLARRNATYLVDTLPWSNDLLGRLRGLNRRRDRVRA